MDGPSSGVEMRAWNPLVAGIREVLHARFTGHAYPLHTHDTWTLFIVDAGAIRYDLDRHDHGAEPSLVSLLPPHVVHDGRPVTEGGYRKRVLYLEPEAIGVEWTGAAVDRPAVRDADLRRAVSELTGSLECRDDALEAETRLAFVIERIRQTLGAMPSPAVSADRRDALVADALRGYLDAHAFEAVTMAAASVEFEVSPTRLARAFAAAFGIAPHAYVLGRRLDAARTRLLAGEAPAAVAAEVGFYDQAHLTRRFGRYLGTTPGRYARSAATT